MKYTKKTPLRAILSLILLVGSTPVAFAQVPPPSPVPTPTPGVVLVSNEKPRLDWNGDFRYRFDHREYELENPEKKSIERLRLRLGFNQNLNEKTQIDVRLASGPGRTTTNQTLGANTESSSNYEVRIDRASLAYKFSDESKLTFGRMANPFYLVGGNDMAWDTDLNFDGITYKFASQFPTVETSLTLSHLILKEGTATAEPVGIHSAQLGNQFKIGETQTLGISLAYLQYAGVKGHSGLVSTTALNGNSGAACGANQCYSEEYKISELGLEYGFPLMGKKFALFADYQTNSAVSENKNAYTVGFKWNRLKNAGDIALNYDFRRLEKDSTLGAFTDAESFNGGTNGEGHRVWIGYQIQDNLGLSFTTFMGKSFIAEGETSRNRTRYLVDLAMTF